MIPSPIALAQRLAIDNDTFLVVSECMGNDLGLASAQVPTQDVQGYRLVFDNNKGWNITNRFDYRSAIRLCTNFPDNSIRDSDSIGHSTASAVTPVLLVENNEIS
jgi:hypothetical protein